MTFYPNAPAAVDNISTSQGQLQSNNQFLSNTAGNLATGFYVLPNDLIMQWGFVASTNSATVVVPFPTTFQATLYSINVTRTRAHNNFPSDTIFEYWIDSGAAQTNLTQFTIINNDAHTWGYYWTAIGV